MANSYVRVIYHCVWSTKSRQNLISQRWESDLWSYIGGIARKNAIHPIQIGGIEDHIHALVEPPKNMKIPELIQILKTPSSHWINQSGRLVGRFDWQVGYGAFSVSPSIVPQIVQYIQGQREHHKQLTFEEEYRRLLESHHIQYNEAYLLG